MTAKRVFVDYMPVLSLLLYVFFDRFPGNGTIPLLAATAFSLPSLLYYLFKIKQPHQVKSFAILCFLGCLLLFFIGPINRRDIFVFVGALSVAIYSVFHLRILKWISFIAVAYTLLFLAEKIFIQQIDVNLLYETSGQSKNYPGFLLVVWTILYSFLKIILDKRTSIVFPALAIIIALFLDGRASLGVILALFILNFYSYNRKFSIISVLIICGAFLYYFDNIMELYQVSAFSEKGFESSRFDMWSAYLDNVNVLNIFIGVDTSKVPPIAAYSGNPHNSFLFYHMSAGLFGLLGLLYLCYKSTLTYFSLKQYLLLFYVLLLIFRISFDSCLFWQTDFIVYFLLVYSFYPSQITDLQIKRIRIPLIFKPIEKIINLL